jgi:hypothetical protein
LLKCIEDFTKKAINSKEHQLQMKEQLAALATTSTISGVDTTSLLAHYQDDLMLLPMEIENMTAGTAAAGATAAAGVVAREAEFAIDGPGPSFTPLPSGAAAADRASLVAGLSLPSLAELQKLQNTEVAGGGQLTARGGGTLSARSAAVAEHIAMLSKENSPRDDEIEPENGTGETTAGAAAVVAVPDNTIVDVNMLFGAWNGSDKK